MPFIIFPLMLFLARRKVGRRGAIVAVGIWILLFVGFMTFPPYFFVAVQVMLDGILLISVIRGWIMPE